MENINIVDLEYLPSVVGEASLAGAFIITLCCLVYVVILKR